MNYFFIKKIIVLIFGILLSYISVFAQYERGFRIIKGNSITFVFNSLDDIQNGITLNAWTQLDVSFYDVPIPANRWKLSVEALSATAVGMDVANNILLSEIEIAVLCPTGTPINGGGWWPLTGSFAVPLEIIANGDNDNTGFQSVTISFRIADVTNHDSDMYTLNLRFVIEEWP